jgi:FkbM family methyltransferase
VTSNEKIRGLDPMYFDRRRSLEGALKWAGVTPEPRNAVDVGANVGQTLETFTSWWPSLHCLSLEPLPEAFQKLEATASKIGARAEVMNIGVGDVSGSLTLHSSKSQSTNSSFNRFNKDAETVSAHRGLRDSPSHLELGTEDNYKVDVKVQTLDSVLASNPGSNATKVFAENGLDILKIDTQGWEIPVLRGSKEVLKRTKVVLTEWQFDDVYGTPPPLHELDKILSDAGFRLWDIAHIYKDLKNLRTLWVDLIYARPKR